MNQDHRPPFAPDFQQPSPVRARWLKVAGLNLPTGRIIACDPFVDLKHASPFERTVEPGEYDVMVGLDYTDYLYAFVRFDDEPVIRWEPAAVNGSGKVLGYGVDSGMGCFVDEQTRDAYTSRAGKYRQSVWERAREAGLDIHDPKVEEIRKVLRSEWDEAVDVYEACKTRRRRSDGTQEFMIPARHSVVLDVASQGNLVTFVSGAGDGVYSSWWGFADCARPVVLVTNFLVEPPPREETEPETSEPARAVDSGARLVDLLLKEEWVEFEPGVDLTPIYQRVQRILATTKSDEEKSRELIDFLLKTEAVVEVYCTDEELAMVLELW